MELVKIYQCFCDLTRLRILNLLARSPLCVCHFQEILHEPQVKISKHLAYLRGRGMVMAEREQNWMIYSLPDKRGADLETNLKCLHDCVQRDPIFKRDLRQLEKAAAKMNTPAKALLPRSRARQPRSRSHHIGSQFLGVRSSLLQKNHLLARRVSRLGRSAVSNPMNGK